MIYPSLLSSLKAFYRSDANLTAVEGADGYVGANAEPRSLQRGGAQPDARRIAPALSILVSAPALQLRP